MAFALGLCELGARAIFPAPPDSTRSPQVAYQSDPELRYVTVPNQQGWVDGGLVTVNSIGFRGRDAIIPKPQGRFRIVVLGDSVTLGWGVNDDETYSARLEQLLSERGPLSNVDVLNGAVGGYDTRQEVGLLERHVARLRPDLVLVGFYSNDVPDILEESEAGAQGGTRVTAANATSGRALHMNPVPPPTGLARQLRRSRAVYILGRVLKRATGTGEWGMSRFSMELDLLAGKESVALDKAWKKVDTQFRRLRQMADEYGFATAIVVLPCREQVVGKYSEAGYQDKIRALAQPLGFHVIDPLPLMIAGARKSEELFIPYDRNHLSPAGHRIAAQAVRDYFEAHLNLRSSRDDSGPSR